MGPSTTPSSSPHNELRRGRREIDSPTRKKRSHTDMTESDHDPSSPQHSIKPLTIPAPNNDTSEEDLEASNESLDDNPSQHLDTTEQDQSIDSDDSAPENELVGFDWKQFEQSYLELIETKNAEEDALFKEFEVLCQFFGIWADVSGTREVERGFKRFKTQSAFVQNEEAQLEERRKHYVKVVDAFKIALKMLAL